MSQPLQKRTELLKLRSAQDLHQHIPCRPGRECPILMVESISHATEKINEFTLLGLLLGSVWSTWCGHRTEKFCAEWAMKGFFGTIFTSCDVGQHKDRHQLISLSAISIEINDRRDRLRTLITTVHPTSSIRCIGGYFILPFKPFYIEVNLFLVFFPFWKSGFELGSVLERRLI